MKKPQIRLVQAWITLHADEFLANWKLAIDGKSIYKIEPFFAPIQYIWIVLKSLIVEKSSRKTSTVSKLICHKSKIFANKVLNSPQNFTPVIIFFVFLPCFVSATNFRLTGFFRRNYLLIKILMQSLCD